MKKVVGIIPARYASSRLPGKVLKELAGKPMIQWVTERAMKAKSVSQIIVATDDQRIQKCVQSFGGECVMTPAELSSGTDRIAYVAKDLDCDIVVNIQGDEPLLEPEEIDLAASILFNAPEAVMGTLIKKIKDFDDLINPNTVKVIVNTHGNAIYFSRIPLPFFRDIPDKKKWLENHTYYQHVGIYAYQKSFLLQFTGWPMSSLERAEKLEQLRALEMGYPILTAETEYEPLGVDTEEDLERVRQIIQLKLEEKSIPK